MAELKSGSELLENVLINTAAVAQSLYNTLVQTSSEDPENHIKHVHELVNLLARTQELNEKSTFSRVNIPQGLLDHIDKDLSPALYDAQSLEEGRELNRVVTGKARAVQELRETLEKDLATAGCPVPSSTPNSKAK
mmetsp:Transcript_10463/g.27411  ORF Transcript_10463/g.27411 Transcript_10463/m.27411 type:complete len:136 (-) Transcript_10463:1781-2188(-)|eukprot:CAMPEP_0113869400 /NCGR_PEP_ID=MMETSP0780_2-20120614/1516_1 /TAXON_ID=652834 /ORGANISM="Palpitomonas bilix" /LENGTH=135 /DNA_ID=CAMNT_0000854575 /DNA_START=242 /DNA_END=649 /DNA_ORIENTATION=- /assembly_acc=CAM_ASM_000599